MSEDRHEMKVSERTSVLELAVELRDSVTGQTPAGRPQVRIGETGVEPVVNPSGYHVFVDIDPLDDPVEVAVDGGDRYRDTRREIALSDRDADRVLQMDLEPAVSYPFPSGATLVRGHVLDTDGQGVASRHLSVRELERFTETAETGEFVMYFGGGDQFDVSWTDDAQTKIVTVDGSYPTIDIRESKDSEPITSITLDGGDFPVVVAGATTSINIRLE